MGESQIVKTTLEVSDTVFRRAKATAAQQGRSLKDFVQEALTEKLARTQGGSAKPWTKLAGGLQHLHAENRRIDGLIDAEFHTIEAEDRP